MPEVRTAERFPGSTSPDNLEYKSVEFKVSDEGKVEAVFSTFGVVDRNGDVMTSDAFKTSQDKQVPMVAAHDWGIRGWIGRGMVQVAPRQARFSGEFFMETADGLEAFKKVKAMGGLQEWSFGFQTLDSEFQKRDGQQIRVIKDIELFEVSPVLVGVGRGTRTVAVKAASSPDDAESKTAIAPHTTATDTESAWDGPGAVADAPNEARVLRYMNTWVDPEGDPDAKQSYKLPHHAPRVGAAANIRGVNNAKARAPQSSAIKPDLAAVNRHLDKHRADAGLKTDGLDLRLMEAAVALETLAEQVALEHIAMNRIGLDMKEGFALTEKSEADVRSVILKLEGLLAGEPQPRPGDNGKEAQIEQGLNELTAALAEAKEE